MGKNSFEGEWNLLVHHQALERLDALLGQFVPSLVFVAEALRPRRQAVVPLLLGQDGRRQPISIDQWHLQAFDESVVPKRRLARTIVTGQDKSGGSSRRLYYAV